MNPLIEKLRQRAAKDTDAIALRSRDKRLSYAELMDAVRQASVQLQSLQLRSIGLYLDNGIDWIIFDLAALEAGVGVVPLPWFFSEAQLAHAIADARVDGIVFDRALPPGLRARGEALPGFSDSRLQRLQATVDESASAPPATAKVSYTSGSTRAPKGIALDADFIAQTAESVCRAIGHLDIKTHLSVLPYATLLENIAGVYLPLMLGRCVHAEAPSRVGLTADLGLDPMALAACFARVRPSSMIVTPRLLEVLCRLVEAGAIDPACLVFVAVGGARVAPDQLRRARAAGIPAYEGYGLTECASVATLNTPHNDRIGSVGRPLPGVSVAIAADGEIRVARGRGTKPVMTGDLGRIDDDGFVYVDGRKSNLIVLENGRNLAPEWIESELDASPLIARSYVYAEADTVLYALLDSDATDAELDAELERVNRGLPAYARLRAWRRPAQGFSRTRNTLTANGRLRRGEIAKQLSASAGRQVSPAPAGRSPAHLSVQENSTC